MSPKMDLAAKLLLDEHLNENLLTHFHFSVSWPKSASYKTGDMRMILWNICKSRLLLLLFSIRSCITQNELWSYSGNTVLMSVPFIFLLTVSHLTYTLEDQDDTARHNIYWKTGSNWCYFTNSIAQHLPPYSMWLEKANTLNSWYEHTQQFCSLLIYTEYKLYATDKDFFANTLDSSFICTTRAA